MRNIALATLLVSSSVFAADVATKTVSYSVGGRGGLNVTYFACDSVEDSVEMLIEKLGGSSVSVDCTGGLDRWGNMPPMPAYVTASFNNVVAGTGQVDTVVLKSSFDANCELNVKTLEAVLPKFENITVVKKRAVCFDNNSRWSYELKISR